jgi:hypothetical protein
MYGVIPLLVHWIALSTNWGRQSAYQADSARNSHWSLLSSFETLGEDEIETFLPQVCNILVDRDETGVADEAVYQQLENIVLDKCQRCFPFGVRFCNTIKASHGAVGERYGGLKLSSSASSSPSLKVREDRLRLLYDKAEAATANGENTTPGAVQELRGRYFRDFGFMISTLARLGIELKRYVYSQRNHHLRAAMGQHNNMLFARMMARGRTAGPTASPGAAQWSADDVARACPDVAGYSLHLPLQHSSDKVFRILRFVESECEVLPSKERCPYMVTVELLGEEFACRSDALFTKGQPIGVTVADILTGRDFPPMVKSSRSGRGRRGPALITDGVSAGAFITDSIGAVGTGAVSTGAVASTLEERGGAGDPAAGVEEGSASARTECEALKIQVLSALDALESEATATMDEDGVLVATTEMKAAAANKAGEGQENLDLFARPQPPPNMPFDSRGGHTPSGSGQGGGGGGAPPGAAYTAADMAAADEYGKAGFQGPDPYFLVEGEGAGVAPRNENWGAPTRSGYSQGEDALAQVSNAQPQSQYIGGGEPVRGGPPPGFGAPGSFGFPVINPGLGMGMQKTFIRTKTWEERKEAIRTSSPFGHLEGWDLRSFIVKSGDDLRKEVLAMQLIELMKEIFASEELDVFLQTYQIVSTGQQSGLVEFVEGARSLDSVKKSSPDIISLQEFFQFSFGQPYTPAYTTALHNFVKSLAGYSLVTYLLQVRDRHNANILLGADGSIIHIDFGFILGM